MERRAGDGIDALRMGGDVERPGARLGVRAGDRLRAGPGGELVQDQFYFAHQTLTGDGGITVRMTGLTSSALQP